MERNQAGHETRDASVRPIVLGGAILAALSAFVCLVVYGMFVLLQRTEPQAGANPMAAELEQVPPEPRLEERPAIPYRNLRAQEDEVLTTYGWADREKGEIHIPIDRAIDLELERGFPTRQENSQ